MINQKMLPLVAAIMVCAAPGTFGAEQRRAPDTSPDAGKDSVALEKKDLQNQLQTSAPANAPIPSPLPASGKILVTSQQKQTAAKEAVKIDHQGQQYKIPAVVNGRTTVALALGGGGARGAAHIGVIKAFQENGIPIDYVVGNSMGAIVGGLYSAGVPLDQIEAMMADGSLRHAYMPMPLPPKILIAPLAKLVQDGHYAGLFSGKRLTRFLDKKLPQPNMNVQDTKIPFSPVATNLIDGKAYRINEGRMSTALKASSAIAPLIQPVAIDDKVYVDGGVRANLPVSAAAETGAGLVIAVLVDEPLVDLPPARFKHLRWIASRMADIVLAVADERQLQFADVIINPNVSGIPILSKKEGDVDKAVQAGYMAAMKAMPGIRARLKMPPHSHSSVAGSATTPQ